MINYFIHLGIYVCLYIILALSLQLSVGFTGMLNLGHIAFFGLGAYTSALIVKVGLPFWMAIIIAGIVPLLFSYILSLPTNKLKGDYLALATLGFTYVIYSFFNNLTSITRGPLGIAGISKPSFFNTNIMYLILCAVIAIGTYLALYKLTESRFGKVIQAVRDDELAARSLGKNSFKVKSISLGVAAFFAGIAGSLYAHYISYISPSSFTLMQLIPILSIVIIGGLGSLKGTVIAAIILTLLPEPLKFIGFPSSIVGPIREIIFAVILLIIIIKMPKGFWGKIVLK